MPRVISPLRFQQHGKKKIKYFTTKSEFQDSTLGSCQERIIFEKNSSLTEKNEIFVALTE